MSLNNTLQKKSLVAFDNRLEESFFSTYNATKGFKNETIEPSLILLNPNNNNLDFSENIPEKTNYFSIYQFRLVGGRWLGGLHSFTFHLSIKMI